MLKKIMIRIAKVAVLASLIVSLVVMSGCAFNVKLAMGKWQTNDDGSKTCIEGTPAQCPLGSIEISGSAGSRT